MIPIQVVVVPIEAKEEEKAAYQAGKLNSMILADGEKRMAQIFSKALEGGASGDFSYFYIYIS